MPGPEGASQSDGSSMPVNDSGDTGKENPMRFKTMRNVTTFLLGLAILVAGVSASFAQDAKAPPKSPPAQATPAKAADMAKLRAEMHRTMAALIEAQSAEKPDAANV